MSPQGRKRVAGMVSRDYRTVSGVGQSYHNQVPFFVIIFSVPLLLLLVLSLLYIHVFAPEYCILMMSCIRLRV